MMMRQKGKSMRRRQQSQRVPRYCCGCWNILSENPRCRCSWLAFLVVFVFFVSLNLALFHVKRISQSTDTTEQLMDLLWPSANSTISSNNIVQSSVQDAWHAHDKMAKTQHHQNQPGVNQKNRDRYRQPPQIMDGMMTTESQVGRNIPLSLLAYQNKSSVDYFACCGAGHRLSRTANAYWVARRVLNFGFRVYWRVCDQIEIFHYLFGPQPLHELINVTSWNQVVPIFNNMPGFHTLYRLAKRTKRPCQCTVDKIQSDAEFYTSLRQRYRLKHRLDRFVQDHFSKASLRIGLHIRAGNNETGDFTQRGRGIESVDEWVQRVASHIRQLFWTWTNQTEGSQPSGDDQKHFLPSSAVLFVASDTPSMLTAFRVLLSNDTFIKVVDYPQARPEEGKGVLFGEMAAENLARNREICLQSWEAMFADMLLLSQVNILVAPRSSSFTQTLPMSLVFADRQERCKRSLISKTSTSDRREDDDDGNCTSNHSSIRLPPAFCEMNRHATVMDCFDTYLQWCCQVHNKYGEHIQVPDPYWKYDYQSKPRPARTCLTGPPRNRRPGDCLPFRWPDYMQLPWNET